MSELGEEEGPAVAWIVGRVAGAGAGRVMDLAREQLSAADAGDGRGRAVHLAVDVGVLAEPVGLVVDRAGGVTPTHPVGHRAQVLAVAGLVAQRPHDDAGVVLVPLDRALDAVQVGAAPAWVVGGVALPHRGAGPLEAVGLQVAFERHVQPELVAQVEEGRVRRVVGGADGVDVVALHQLHVAAHGLRGEGAAVVGVELVPVDAAQQDAAPVHPQDAALVDGDGAEAEPDPHAFAVGGQVCLVEVRVLRAPGAHCREPELAVGRLVVDAEGGDADPHRCVRVHVHAQPALAGGVVVVGMDEGIPDAAGGAGQQCHVAEDARQAPGVLVLQVGAGGELVHPHGQHVAAGP